MKNLIKKILKEQVSEKEIQSGFDDFYQFFEKNYSMVEDYDVILHSLIEDIKKSPTPKITLTDRGMFCGMSLTDNVILSKSIFNRSLYSFIFVLFHEIAHQYQYKKYGKDLLYSLTTKELTEETLDKLIEIEQVADRFGENMANKYSARFKIPKGTIVSPYKNIQQGKSSYRNLITKIQEEIKKGNITCIEQMETFMIEHLTAPTYPTYSYTGSSYYGGYGSSYPSRYSQYGGYDKDDDFYEKSYKDYEKSFKPTSDYEEDIVKVYEDELIDLSHNLSSEINDIIGEAENLYGQAGVNILIDMLNEEGFGKFFYETKGTVDPDIDIEDIMYKVDEDFYPVIEELKKYIEESLHSMMDEVEKTYGWEASNTFIELMDDAGFNDMW